MNALNCNPEMRTADITDQSCDSRPPGPVETGINAGGLALTVGGSVISLVSPELGFFVVGTGAGLVIGGLVVGYAVRHSNG